MNIYNKAILANGGIGYQCGVYNPDTVSSYAENFTNLNYSLTFGWETSYSSLIANKLRVPANPYHFVIGSLNTDILANPGNKTGSYNRKDGVYINGVY